jgi:hypothetical protein
MTMPVCKVCKESKPIRDMRVWGTNPTETCQVCHDAKKAAKNGSAATPPEAPKDSPRPEPRPINRVSEVIVEASLGFAAKVDGENLVISQANSSRENDDDNVTLTRSEAKRLFDSFGEWIVGAA